MGKAWDIWESELERVADSTRYSYLQGVGRFLEYLDTDYEGLYEMKLSDLRSDDPRDLRRVERHVSQFMFKLVKKGSASASASRIGVAVGHFMRSQGITFTLLKNEWPKGESIGQRIVLKDQIKHMYENASAWMRFRNRALMMFAKDTGLRISDIERFDVNDYLDARGVSSNKEVFKEFKPITTKKTKATAYVCIGPESVETIDVYLKERGAQRGEPLFLDQNGNRLKVTALSELFRRFGDMLEDGGRVSAHSFRKYNETMMEVAGVPLNWIKRYQGRKVSDSTGPDSNPQDLPNLLITRYIEAYDTLRVFTEERELEAVKQELTQYKIETDILRVTQHNRVSELEGELQRMREEQAQIQQQISSMLTSMEKNVEAITRSAEHQAAFNKRGKKCSES